MWQKIKCWFLEGAVTMVCCLRAYCDKCPYRTNLKTICKYCGKVKA